MREEIERIKSKNGNEKINRTDLIWYLIGKVDKIDDKLESGAGKIASNRASVRFLKIITFSIIFPALAGLLFLLLNT